jgi:hypothetical protein
MTNEEIEIILGNTISEIDRLSSSIENIREILAGVLEKPELPQVDRERLKELLSRHRSDGRSRVLSEAGNTIRRRSEKEQTKRKTPFLQGKKPE